MQPVFHDTYTGPRWTYGLNNRPLLTGAVPPGWIIWSNQPHPGFRFGTVDYPRELAVSEVTGYELTPITRGE